jgi:tetratricopeptide (TPR) repeat protein
MIFYLLNFWLNFYICGFMKKYFALIIVIIGLLLSFNIHAHNSYREYEEWFKLNCTCARDASFQSQDLYKNYKSWRIGCSPKDRSYPYHLINAAIWQRWIKSPLYYFEYLNNFHVFNDTLLNSLNSNIDDYLTYPTLYPDAETVRNTYYRCIKKNEETNENIRKIFKKEYDLCKQYGHTTISTLYDQGFLAFIEGDIEESIDYAETYIALCKEQNKEDEIQSNEMLLLGNSYLELAQYSKALDVLSDIIRKDPTNKKAYFSRCTAHFELGNFDEALFDFEMSDKGKDTVSSYKKASNEFTHSLISSACQGSIDAAIDFVPSMCYSAYGLGKTLWTTAQHPIDSSKNFANACYEMGQCAADYCKNLDWQTVDGYVEQIKILYERFDQLSETEKGEIIGYTIGKYGVDIFASTATVKCVTACRNLKAANKICNLEAMAISSLNKEAVVCSALKHALEREAYFKNVKLLTDKQNKHILGKHNYEPGKGVFEHKDPQYLLKNFAGKGRPAANEFSINTQYKEIVDFGEHIGIWKNKEGHFAPTTKGTIHYSKEGAHIIPAHPDSKVW